MKSRQIECTDLHNFIDHPVPVQASNWDIDDARQLASVSAA